VTVGGYFKLATKTYVIEYSPYRGTYTVTLYNEYGKISAERLVDENDLKGFCECLEMFGYLNASNKEKDDE
jgi:hypothetical protein